MALIGRQQSSGAFLKLDDISSQFDGSITTFNLTVGGDAFFPINPYTLLVSLAGVIQEPIAKFTINQHQINFASAPASGADFFIVVLATTNVDPLRSLTVGTYQDHKLYIYMFAHLQLKIEQVIHIQLLLTSHK